MPDAPTLVHLLFEHGRLATHRESEIDDPAEFVGRCRVPWQHGYEFILKSALKEMGVADASVHIQ
eukprot:1967899-Karenia_brevis.AAC.1